MQTYKVVVIKGDGIGPELVDATMQVLDAVQSALGTFRLGIEYRDGGAELYRRSGENLSAETLQAIRQADATMKGPVGLPDVRLKDGTEAGTLGGVLRTSLDTYANLRPVRLLPGVRRPRARRPARSTM